MMEDRRKAESTVTSSGSRNLELTKVVIFHGDNAQAREQVTHLSIHERDILVEAKPIIPDKGVSSRTWFSTGSKLFTLGGYACNFFSNKYTGYIGPLTNFLAFNSSIIVEHIDRQEERKKLAEKRYAYMTRKDSGDNIPVVNPTRNYCSSYGLKTSCPTITISTITVIVNAISDILMLVHQGKGARDEDEILKIAAVCLGAGAIALHWIDEHLKHKSIISEQDRYDKSLDELTKPKPAAP